MPLLLALSSGAPGPAARGPAILRAGARLRYPAEGLQRFRGDARGSRDAPTRCSSASSTTIPTPTGSSWRSSKGSTRRGVPVIVALEMFERDVQPLLERYLAGEIAEEQFLQGIPPWPRYATDYRPLIEFARAHKLPVDRVQRAAPDRVRRRAERASASIDKLGGDRGLAARELSCPTSGSYFDRFAEAMGGHAGADDQLLLRPVREGRDDGGGGRRRVRETTGRVTIVHVNGAFHSDFGEGAATAPAAGCRAAASPSSPSCRSPTSTRSAASRGDLKRGRLPAVYHARSRSLRSTPIT